MCELLPVNIALGLFDQYKRAVTTGDPYTAEFPISETNVMSEWIRVQAVRLEDGVAITASDITERRRAEDKIKYLAHHDHLTGHPHRSVLVPRIKESAERSKSQETGVGLLFIDVDDFKQINDTHGHLIGDEVLACVAARLSHAVRSTDSVVRMGGDEFAVILSDLELDHDLDAPSQKIVLAMQDPIQLKGLFIHVTCSVGAALMPVSAMDVGELVRKADAAMYSVKRAGKNGTHTASQTA